ncbi:MAG: hypothetical protein JWN93_1125, partial [Hyphomicrobiales bacterium]|nr:hypothetical protein [Hyphomicrobiales bacterium]
MFSTKAPNEKARLRALGLAAAILCGACAPAVAADSCRVGPVEQAVVTGVDARLELTLADGRTVRLAGVEPPPGAEAAALAAQDVATWTEG